MAPGKGDCGIPNSQNVLALDENIVILIQESNLSPKTFVREEHKQKQISCHK